MILAPLLRILSRLDYATTQVIEKWTDPILLAMGMLAWSGRIYRLQSEKAESDKPEGPKTDRLSQGIVREAVVDKDDKKEPLRKKKDNIAYADSEEMGIIGGGEGITA